MIRLFNKLSEIKDTVMSTEIIIKADLDKNILREALNLARDMERKLSAYREDSYISKINRYAGLSPVKCPSDVVSVIKESIRMAKETGGLFDPTIGVLTQGLFGFGTGRERIPSHEEVEKAKKLVDYRKLRVSGNEVFLEERGMRLDLGGIGKGWTSQKLAEFLIDRGASKVLVSIGGEICCYGKSWRIAVKGREGIIGIVETKEDKTTISTSGDYERYIKSRNIHHILNPLKGTQENFYTNLTLIDTAFKGAELDALATACFNLQPDIVERITNSFIMVDKIGGNIRIGSGLRKKVRGIYLLCDG